MRDSFQLYTTHMKYWSSIATTVVLFGAALGYVGARHAETLPKLSLSTVATEVRFTGIQTEIVDLDTRLTAVERKVDNKVSVPARQPK